MKHTLTPLHIEARNEEVVLDREGRRVASFAQMSRSTSGQAAIAAEYVAMANCHEELVDALKIYGKCPRCGGAGRASFHGVSEENLLCSRCGGDKYTPQVLAALTKAGAL